MGSDVPFNDLSRVPAEVRTRLTAAMARPVERGWYLRGPETEAFERAFAAFCGTAGCVGVANGTDALEIALRAVGCQPGDEVVMTANAGMYAATAAVAVGCVPAFVEVDPATLLIDVDRIAEVVGQRTRAVVVTHLYGNVVDVDAVRAALPSGVRVVEDGAQAHGASWAERPVGSLGDVAAFSFYPTKNLGALGDAGAVVSGDTEVLDRVRALAQYGWQERYRAVLPGGRNSRIDEVQAAVLAELLPLVQERNARRRQIRAAYAAAVDGRDDLSVVAGDESMSEPVAHLCVVRAADRERFAAHLREAGVSTAVHYPVPDHHQPALQAIGSRHGALPVTEEACRQVLSLPCFPELTDAEVERVTEAIRTFT